MMTRPANLMMGTVGALALMGASFAYAQDGANAQDGEMQFGPEQYSVQTFETDRFIGTVEIIVEDRDTIEISASGDAEHMEHFEVNTSGNSVEITFDDPRSRRRAWSDWTSFWRHNDNKRLEEFPTVVVRVPEGTPVDLNGMMGSLDIGDLNAPFEMESNGSLRANIGDVTSASIRSAGSGRTTLGDVNGDLSIYHSGSAGFVAGSSAHADVRSSGSGDTTLGHVAAGLDLQNSGSGSVRVQRADGVVSIRMSGSGDADIEAGDAQEVEVSVSGSGDVDFDGSATDATLSTRGSGRIHLASVNGDVEVRTSGSGSVTIDSGMATSFDASTRGSGNIRFGGTANSVHTSSSGSGDVYINNRQDHSG